MTGQKKHQRTGDDRRHYDHEPPHYPFYDSYGILVEKNRRRVVDRRMHAGPSDEDHTFVMLFHGEKMQLRPEDPPLTVGRGAESCLCIDEHFVSRQHAVIEFIDGHFCLKDSSRNGSFVHIKGEEGVLRVHQAERILSGEGFVAFGQGWQDSMNHLLRFRVVNDKDGEF